MIPVKVCLKENALSYILTEHFYIGFYLGFYFFETIG